MKVTRPVISCARAAKRPRPRAAKKLDEYPSPHDALKPRTTPYQYLNERGCASQQNRPLDFRFGSITSIALRTRVRLAPISDMSGDCQFRRDVPQAGMHRPQAPRLQRFGQILSIAMPFHVLAVGRPSESDRVTMPAISCHSSMNRCPSSAAIRIRCATDS